MKATLRGLIRKIGSMFIIAAHYVLYIPFYIRAKQKRLAIVCIFMACVTLVCTGLSLFNLIFAKAEPEITEPTTAVSKPVDSNTEKPDALSLLKPNTGKVNYPAGMLEKYKAIYSVNTDIIGWLKIKNTSIDTVVTQGNDNSHYLHKDFYGKYTRYGNLFLDYRNNPKDLNQNTILYGHTTITNLQVFYDLYKYKNPEFFKSVPVIEYGTLYHDYKWKVCAVFISSTKKKDDNGYFFNYISTSMNASGFKGYLNQVKQRKLYTTGVDVNSTDKLLTLSTCTYDNDLPGQTVDSRLVVVARLLREGESEKIDVSKVKANPGFRRPQVWYDHYGLNNPYANSERWYP